MKIRMPVVAALGLCLVLLSSCYQADMGNNKWLNTEEGYLFDEVGIPTKIPEQIVFPVPFYRSYKAIKLLDNEPIVEVDNKMLRRLIGTRRVEADKLLTSAYKNLKNEAQVNEDTAKDPFYADQADFRYDNARLYNLAADNVKKLLGKTKPYLVRGLAIYPPGRFSIHLVGSELWVFNGSLGSDRPTPVKRPVVVFLPYKPKTVHVGASSAR